MLTLSFRILRSTFDDVLADLGATFRITMPLFLATLALVGLFMAAIFGAGHFGVFDQWVPSSGAAFSEVDLAETDISPWIIGGFFFTMFVLAVVWIAAFIRTAILWHRYVALAERPDGWLPRGPKGLGWPYFWESFLILLISGLAGGLGGLVLGRWVDTYPDGSVYLDPFGLPDPMTLRNFGLTVLLSFIVGGLTLRISVLLPALAIGRRMSFGEAWRATKSGQDSGVFGLVSVLFMVAFAIIEFVTGLLEDLGLMTFLSVWFQIIVGIGIVTRLYLWVCGQDSSEGTPPGA